MISNYRSPRSCEVRRTIQCIGRWLNIAYIYKMKVLSSLSGSWPQPQNGGSESGKNLPPPSGNKFEAIQASKFTLGESLNPVKQLVAHRNMVRFLASHLSMVLFLVFKIITNCITKLYRSSCWYAFAWEAGRYGKSIITFFEFTQDLETYQVSNNCSGPCLWLRFAVGPVELPVSQVNKPPTSP